MEEQKQTFSVSEEKKEKTYLDYKSKLKTISVLNLVVSITIIVIILFAVFIPIFQINSYGYTKNFSVLQEVIRTFKLAKTINDEASAFYFVMALIPIFTIIFGVIALIYSVTIFIPILISLCTNKDDAFMLEFDNIQNSVESKNKNVFLQNSSVSFVIMFIFDVIYGKIFSRFFVDFNIPSTYFALVNGVNFFGFFLITLIIGFITLKIVVGQLRKNIKLDLIKIRLSKKLF